ncbi:MAG TPA: triose-phosphate isomerase [Phycisphaerales bacterium]|nr:triose-phosphate isomerase [Phycisphaerales bacterium]
MARTPYVGGNWKMNTDRASAEALAAEVALGVVPGVEVAIFPPFPYLIPVGEAVLGADARAAAQREGARPLVKLGAQDCYFEKNGAFTGEVSPEMLSDCAVQSVLTGHSERRHVLGEPDELVNRKTRAVLDAGLGCVLCIGERLDERKTGQTDAVNERQLRAGLSGVAPEQMSRVVVAYEPVWAIGTGVVATPADAQDAHANIRALLADLYSPAIAASTRIIYGGSLKPSNAAEILAQPDVDGGLVGGASLKAADFLAIVQAAARRHR